MGGMIQPEVLTGNSVYGVRQMQYSVNGTSGNNFIDAVTLAAFKQAASIEDTTSAYVQVVKARQKKIDELGEALSYVAKAVGKISKKTKTTDKIEVDNASYVKTVASRYGVSLSWSDGNKMKRGDLQKAQTNIQYAIDREDNDIQQDIVTMQSFMSKRDNAYSNASKLVSKANRAASSTIKNLGD